MGVMSCYRKDCESILCDTYVDDIGYVCSECQREFNDYLDKENVPHGTEGEIKEALRDFMKTRKGKHLGGKEMSVDEFFNQHTR